MTAVMVVSGVVILLLTIVDVLVTTLTLGGGGLLTSHISSGIWRLALKLHNWRSNHRLLLLTGWTILVATALLWFLLIFAGWLLIFSASDTAVVRAENNEPATPWERVYYVIYTLSTLGMGDFQPLGRFWEVSTAVASVNGFVLLTLTIAYLLPMVAAATQKQQVAVYISCLGGTPDEILSRAWNGKDFGQLDQHLIALTPQIALMGGQNLNYPVLHYLHTIDRSRSLVLSLVALDEALTLLQYGVKQSAQPDPAVLGAIRRANAAFLQTLSSSYIEPATDNPPLPSLDLLRQQGIPTVSDSEFCRVTQCVAKRRKLLLSLIEEDGWKWDAVASSQSTSRTASLDDHILIDDVVLR